MLKSIEQERDTRLRIRGEGPSAADLEPVETLAKRQGFTGAALEEIRRAEAFSRSLQYSHRLLDFETYLSHVLRVARLCITEPRPPAAQTVIIALLHNVLETTELSLDALRKEFGSFIADGLRLLTVDRQLQCDAGYKRRYYKDIDAGGVEIRNVKVFDKLDNLFTLCLNKDERVRTRYLAEIKQYVVPMVRQDLAHLVEYFDSLVLDAERTGGMDNPYHHDQASTEARTR